MAKVKYGGTEFAEGFSYELLPEQCSGNLAGSQFNLTANPGEASLADQIAVALKEAVQKAVEEYRQSQGILVTSKAKSSPARAAGGSDRCLRARQTPD